MQLRNALIFLVLRECVEHGSSFVQPNNSCSFNTRLKLKQQQPSSFTGRSSFAMTPALNNQKAMYPVHQNTKTSLDAYASSSNLFTSCKRRHVNMKKYRFDTSTEASASPGDEDQEKPLFRKLFDATVGRFVSLFLFFWVCSAII